MFCFLHPSGFPGGGRHAEDRTWAVDHLPVESSAETFPSLSDSGDPLCSGLGGLSDPQQQLPGGGQSHARWAGAKHPKIKFPSCEAVWWSNNGFSLIFGGNYPLLTQEDNDFRDISQSVIGISLLIEEFLHLYCCYDCTDMKHILFLHQSIFWNMLYPWALCNQTC